MVTVDTIGRVRRAYWVQKKKIKAIARELRLSRGTVRRIVRSGETVLSYERKEQPLPKLGPFVEQLDKLLEANMAKRKRERLTTKRLTEQLQGGLVTRVATTRCGAMRNAGARSMRRRAQQRLCRKSSRPAKPTSSIGATRSSSWMG